MARPLRILAAAALLLAAPPAVAQTTATAPPICATKAIKATGGVGLLEGAARSKARSAWMKKVRESKKLGPTYAVWLRAKSPGYACKRTAKNFVCDAIATPCKI